MATFLRVLVAVLAIYPAKGFNLPTPRFSQQRFHLTKGTRSNAATSLSSASIYGRGAEIWPECNEDPVQLKDSFPDGIIPESALEALQIPRPPIPQPSGNLFQRILARRLLGVDVTPTVIASLLFLRGLVRPLDIMTVIAITGYWTILQRYAQSTRADGLTPALPALPPQGHVPDLVSNPLGISFTNSNDYDQWLKMSALLSLVLPIGLIVKHLAEQQLLAAKLFAGPLFLLCCQAMSESIARKTMAPLPIRILIPVLYNAVRLVPLWACASFGIMGRLGRLVAAANLGYWALNLFVFFDTTCDYEVLAGSFLWR